MSQNHAAWKPSLATKPAHLSSATPNKPVQSLAALQGATSAFATGVKPTTSNVKQLQHQYEPKPWTRSNEDQENTSSGQHDDGADAAALRRSPSRGRRLGPQHAQLAGARCAASTTSPALPSTLDRTPSTLAARIASATPSPVRGNAGNGLANKTSQYVAGTGASAGSAPTQNIYLRPAMVASRLSHNNGRATSELDLSRPPRLSPGALVQSHTGGHEEPRKTNQDAHPESGPMPSRDSLRPPAPAPRRGGTPVVSPVRANVTGPKQNVGLSREEIINRMADAMVASSLATSRPPSPTKSMHDSSGRRHSASASNLYRLPAPDVPPVPKHHKPVRPMKQTLRRTSPEDEEDSIEIARRGRRHLVRKHPNKHHEGDRKRWRDKVTESERRRYEGVFAANRGLLLRTFDPRASPSRRVDPTSESNQVVNVVVRDIWERSRLSAEVLEQIYDLVATDDPPVLDRSQFVVGLWLIDQKLKGRKLPVRVSDSVWASVRHSQGIKVGKRS